MLATLIPLFDENVAVRAYSLFAQKRNSFLDPGFLGTASYDGIGVIAGLDIIQGMGIETLSADKDVFVEVNNISLFADINSQCSVDHERLILLCDNTVLPEKMYIDRLKALKADGYQLAMKKMGTTTENTLFVGDQLFTDVYGARRTGITSILVKPIHPKEEIQIVLKRYLEKIVLFFYRRRGKKGI